MRWLALLSSQVFSTQNSTLLCNFASASAGVTTPKFVKGIHVKWKVVNFTFVVGDWCVCIAVELRKLIDIIPNFFFRSMENMRAIFMDLNTFYFFGIDVTCNVVSFFDNLYFYPFSCLMKKDRTEQPCTNN